MPDPLVRRPGSVDLVAVDSSSPAYMAINFAGLLVLPAVLLALPVGFVTLIIGILAGTGWGGGLRLYLTLMLAVVAGSLVFAVYASFAMTPGHVRRLQFVPPDRPEKIRILRGIGASEVPLNAVSRVEVLAHEELPYGSDDPQPAIMTCRDVVLRTRTEGTIQLSAPAGVDVDPLADALADLLTPAGVPVERRTESAPRTEPSPEFRARLEGWWPMPLVAEAWGVELNFLKISAVARRFGVEIAFLGGGMWSASREFFHARKASRLTELIRDGSAARVIAADLLMDLEGLKRPLAPGGNRLSADAAFLLDDDLLARYWTAKDLAKPDRRRPGVSPEVRTAYLDYARYSLARVVLGASPPAAAPVPAPDAAWVPPADLPGGPELAAEIRRALAERPTINLQ